MAEFTMEQLEQFVTGNWRARCVAAQHGVGLDVLVNDEDWVVRTTVAEQGYGLDILVNDPSREVRIAVAKQGYGLDKLVDDADYHVANAALDKLREVYGVTDANVESVLEEFAAQSRFSLEGRLADAYFASSLTGGNKNARNIEIEKD